MRTHITTMGTNHVFQNVFLSQLSMEFVTKENDETTIGFIHLQWNSDLLPVQIVPSLCYFSYYACILAVPLQVYKSYCSFIILFSHEFHW